MAKRTYLTSSLAALAMSVLATACTKGGGSSTSLTNGAAAPAAPTPAPAAAASPPTASPAVVYKLTPKTVANPTLFTKSSSGTGTCTEVTFTLEGDGQPAAATSVELTVAATSGGTDLGTITPAPAKSDKDGLVTADYCSGDAAGTFAVVAKIDNISVNSGTITVVQKPTYSLSFASSDLTVHGAAAPAATPPVGGASAADLGVVYLNLLDSGPHACAHLYFKLTASGAPLSAQTVRFMTQDDFPMGAKLGLATDTAKIGVDPANQHTFAYYDATSNGSGQIDVPVCAGQQLGSLLVSGTFTGPDGSKVIAQSPVIVIRSGVTTWLDLSLTYEQPDGHTLLGYLNTNSTDAHAFTVNLGSRHNGDAITDYSIFAAAESGKITLVNGGSIDPANNTAKFTINALNLQTDRPYAVTNFGASPANTVCDVETLSQGPADVRYPDLAKNWRSTLIYGVRGQEYFHDAFGDGLYHPGCTGFWDKNQNGVYDAGDVITADPFNDHTLHNECDWFIDLPTPFVDVNENGVYDSGIDHLIGSTYQEPNGKWDNDTTIWKYDYTPIYMGTSAYALQHSTITHNNLSSFNDPLGTAYFTDLRNRGLLGAYPDPAVFFNLYVNPIDNTTFGLTGSQTQQTQAARAYFYFFAQSVCGTPMPGGTAAGVTFQDVAPNTYGERPIVAHFYTQPLDYFREPSRRLLNNADGASSAKINFDAVRHPAAVAAYPVVFSIEVSACNTPCSGDLAIGGEGVACDMKQQRVKLTVDTDTLSQYLQINPVKTCTCATGGATFQKGVCACPSGTSNVGGHCQ